MATGTANSPRPGPVAQTGAYNQFIDQQLAKTQRRVKLIDLGTFGMGLFGGILAYLLLVVLIDHWVMEMGWFSRFVALAVLLVGTGYYVAMFLVPLLARRVNPVYAAWAIEQSNPSLKNSLINFLMFRGESSRSGQLVHRALRQRAAIDLKQVNIALAVDQTRLIMIGYAVVALMVLFAVYMVFSPKDVFQTIWRVSAPWADIARPSRVTISDVQPGDEKVVFGEHVVVSARVEGLDDDEIVTLVYTTQDKQTVGRIVKMKRPDNRRRFQCKLPPDPAGAQQNLTYRIEIRKKESDTNSDEENSVNPSVVARSADFQLEVLPAPTILIDKIEYEYPPYTLRGAAHRQGTRVVKNQGNIHAIEGTQVTIKARANQEIQTASIQFDSDPPERMESNGKLAEYSFDLLINRDAGTPEYSSYQLSFTSTGNLQSQRPVIYKISVTADLAPVVEILTPTDDHIEIPVNSHQRIEIRAVDPDFGLSRVTLRAEATNKLLLENDLLTDPDGRLGQVVLNYDFSPEQLGLKVGDKVLLWADAEDNRSLPVEPDPGPNNAQTRDYHIIIAPPDSAKSGESHTGSDVQQDKPAPDNAQEARQESSDQKEPESDPPKTGEQQTGEQQTGEQQTGEQQTGEQQTGEQQTGEQQTGEQQTGEQQTGEQQTGEQQTGEQQAGEQQTGEQQTGEQQTGEQQTGAAGSQSQSGDQSSGGTGQSDQSMPAESLTGQQDNGSSADQTSGAGSQQGGADGGNREEPRHDGEVFEQLMNQLENDSGTSQQGTSKQQPSTPDEKDPAAGSQQNSPLEPEDGSTGTGQDSDKTKGEPNDAHESTEQSTGNSDEKSKPEGNDSAAEDTGTGEKESSGGPGDESMNSQGDDQTKQTSSGSKEGPDQKPGQSTDSAGDETGQEQGGQEQGGQEQGGQEQGGQEQGGQEQGGQEKGGQEKGGQEQGGQEKGGQEQGGQEQGGQEQGGQEQGGQEKGGQEKGGQEKGGQEKGGQEKGGQEKGGQEKGGQEKGGQEKGGQEKGGQEKGGQEKGGQEKGGQEKGGQEKGGQEKGGQEKGGQEKVGQEKGGQEKGGQEKGGQEKGGQEAESGNKPDGGETSESGATPNQPTRMNDDGKQPSDQNRSDQSQAMSGATDSQPQGGGRPDNSVGTPTEMPNDIQDGDEANLDYARKATDMVLERLDEQRKKPDPELLKSLGWTEDELRQFVDRWTAMKRRANEEGGAAQDDLNDALRSLGLRSPAPDRRRASAESDQVRGLLDGGNRTRPPAAFLDKFNAYKKGAARGSRRGG